MHASKSHAHRVLILVHFVRLHGIKSLSFAKKCGATVPKSKARMKLVAISMLLGLVITLVSTLRKSELDLSFNLPMRPCIVSPVIFPPFPVKQTDYGFPAFWLSSTETVHIRNNGSIADHHVTYSLLWSGVLTNIILYAICSGMLIHLTIRWRNIKKLNLQKHCFSPARICELLKCPLEDSTRRENDEICVCACVRLCGFAVCS